MGSKAEGLSPRGPGLKQQEARGAWHTAPQCSAHPNHHALRHRRATPSPACHLPPPHPAPPRPTPLPPPQESAVAPVIADYWERAEFPHSLVPSFAALGLAGGPIKGYGCPVRAGRAPPGEKAER